MTAFRILPKVNPDTEFFWTGGASGELRFLRCGDCHYYIHPPTPVCPRCLSRNVAPEAVSGRASVATYTVNYQPWIPGFDPPYVIAIVEIEEQPDVRLMTNVVECPPDAVYVGMPVEVRFEQHDDVWIPLFAPRAVVAS
jgi:uncharacterized OB-fold protein